MSKNIINVDSLNKYHQGLKVTYLDPLEKKIDGFESGDKFLNEVTRLDEKIDESVGVINSQLEHIEDNIVIINNLMTISTINEKIKNGGTIIFKNGTYLINKGETIRVASNSKIYFEPNAILKYNDLTSTHYNILTIHECKNVLIEDVNITGCRDEHIGEEGEWGHGISITSSKNIKIIRPYIEKTWGDGIYIGYLWDETEPVNITKNIQILDSHIYRCSRNGIALCSGDDILIDRALIEEVDRCFPKAGIDIEPECNDTSIVHIGNVTLKNITTVKNDVGIGFITSKNFAGCQNTNINIYNHINYDSMAVAVWWEGGTPHKFFIDGAKYYNTPNIAIQIDRSTMNSLLSFNNIDIIDKTRSSVGGDYAMHSAILVTGNSSDVDYGNLKFKNINIDTSNCAYHFSNIIAFENAIGNIENFSYKNITIDNVNSVGESDGSYRLSRIDASTLKVKNCNNTIVSNYYTRTLNRDLYTNFTYPVLSEWSNFYIDSSAIDGVYTVCALSNSDNFSVNIKPVSPVVFTNKKSYYILRLGEIRFYKKGNNITFLNTAINGGFID